MIKTDLEKFEILESKLKELNFDEIPEIIALPIGSGYGLYRKIKVLITDN
ncbi:hypothetical protein [Okeania sp. SIO1I7]|nr:hypothetical protein [Okeania sp. SIO1I7]NET25229.1 divalent-cation tolerance protein CutA [Okeania sp. SIO1I7]